MVNISTVGNDQIVAEMTIEASPETVFSALTDPQKLKAWWGDEEKGYRTEKWTIDLRVGGKWRGEGKGANGEPFLVEGEYVEIDPPRILAYTWRPSWVETSVTTVRFVLTAKNNGTHLVMTHSGFAGNEKAIQAHQGWPQVLGWLKTYSEA